MVDTNKVGLMVVLAVEVAHMEEWLKVFQYNRINLNW